MSLQERNNEIIKERFKIIASDNEKLKRAIALQETAISNLNSRVDQLLFQLQQVVAGKYGSGPTER